MSKNNLVICVLLALGFSNANGQQNKPAHKCSRPIHTYSIVARDPQTGEMGVAVQSHWFSVGSLVTWAEAGVGAIATQSFVDVTYGPLGLDLMRAGRSAEQTLAALKLADSHPEIRQVAMASSPPILRSSKKSSPSRHLASDRKTSSS